MTPNEAQAHAPSKDGNLPNLSAKKGKTNNPKKDPA